MAAVYFVDSENVGDSWIELLEEADNQILVFYTGHSPRLDYSKVIQLMNTEKRPEFIKCYEGSNALDFQLVTYLGYALCVDNSKEMIILSNDTGFDVVVNFWKDRNMNVKRITNSNMVSLRAAKKKESVSDEKSPDKEVTKDETKKSPDKEVTKDETKKSPDKVVTKDETKKISGVCCKELHTIINCIGTDQSSDIHLALVHFYGSKNGENIYKHLKKEKFAAPAVTWKKETKMKKLMELIFQYKNDANIAIPDSLTGFIINGIVADKNAMGNKITKQYGEAGSKIHKMMKPFYKTLSKIKKK